MPGDVDASSSVTIAVHIFVLRWFWRVATKLLANPTRAPALEIHCTICASTLNLPSLNRGQRAHDCLGYSLEYS